MSAREVIRLFDALPEAERKEVAEHVKNVEQITGSIVNRASVTQIKDIAERVFATNDELFRKLAQ